jgi:hypothetical protein
MTSRIACKSCNSVLAASLIVGALLASSGCAELSKRNRELGNIDPYQFPPVATITPFCAVGDKNARPENARYEIEETCERLTLSKGTQDASTQPKNRTIGVALSGGGSKSAPFELGVLAGLEESGVLEKVDYISTVSGGSYAATYFYSHLLALMHPLDSEVGLTREQMFWDCLPAKYGQMFSPEDSPVGWSLRAHNGVCPSSEGQVGRYWPLSSTEDSTEGDDPLREASHLRGYQPIFDDDWAYDKYDGTLWDFRVGVEAFGKIGVNIAALAIPNFFFNTVFDQRIDLGYIKRKYADGIARTYGETANNLRLDPSLNLRTAGNSESLQRLTFEKLRELYVDSNNETCPSRHKGDGLCNTPLWIINATAGSSATIFPLAEFSPYTAQRNGFEFTAFGYGSGLYGRRPWHDSPLEPQKYYLAVLKAVGASAAFADAQQRQEGGTWGPLLNVGVLHLANFDWGADIPNYRSRTQAQYHRLKIIHSILPWFLYFFNYEKETNDSLYIHLSDGGMSEDLGAAALLRRHVTDLVVVDASSDPQYQLGDLCELNTQLQIDQENKRAVFLDIGSTVNVPLAGCAGSTVDNPFGIRDGLWQPVIRGRVCRMDGSACTDDTAEARLYILKPAVNSGAKAPQGVTLAESMVNARRHQLKYIDCAYPDKQTDKGYPCEVIGYLTEPVTTEFPQDNLFSVTLASNAYIFGAYKELGRFYARHIHVQEGAEGMPLVVDPTW